MYCVSSASNGVCTHIVLEQTRTKHACSTYKCVCSVCVCVRASRYVVSEYGISLARFEAARRAADESSIRIYIYIYKIQ